MKWFAFVVIVWSWGDYDFQRVKIVGADSQEFCEVLGDAIMRNQPMLQGERWRLECHPEGQQPDWWPTEDILTREGGVSWK